MKLGTETASMTNYLMSGTKGEPTPVVGMGATILMWTDRHAATIVKVTPTQVHVQRDKATRIDANGMSEMQEHVFEADPTADVEIFRKTKRGWRKAGGGHGLRIGDRDEYHDYSF
jgi:hypothetical protein